MVGALLVIGACFSLGWILANEYRTDLNYARYRLLMKQSPDAWV